MSFLSRLLSPWLILASVVGGALIGFFNKELALELLPFGLVYLKLLQMLVLPIILTAVISGLGNLLISGIERHKITRLVLFLITGLMVASLIGVLFGIIGKPGIDIQHDSRVTMGKIIIETESNDPENGYHKTQTPGLFSFVQAMIPVNIFDALARGENLAILFFAILVGIAMGLLNSSSSKLALEVISAFFDVFLNIISWLMYLLPFGLFCLFAGQLAQVGIEIFLAASKLVLFIYLACIMSMFCYSLIIWWKTRKTFSYWESLAALRSPLFIALGTASSFATIPASLTALKNNLRIDKNLCDLVIPIGATINPPASVLQFAISSIFIAQLYGLELGFNELSLILIGSILAGIASSSAPSVIGLSMIAFTLEPLGLPTSVAIILLIAIDPIVDPILTALNVHANCAMTVVLADDNYEMKAQQELS